MDGGTPADWTGIVDGCVSVVPRGPGRGGRAGHGRRWRRRCPGNERGKPAKASARTHQVSGRTPRTGQELPRNHVFTVGTHIAYCNHMNPSDIQTPSMDNRPRIRDTSGQDHVVARPTSPWRRRKAWLAGGAGGVAVLLLAGWVASGWLPGRRPFDASRVRIAPVTRGDLVRDLSADGRVSAANSPTLHAVAAGTGAVEVVAGDVVEKGEPLAVIDSPELRSKLVQEESTLASMEAEASRAVLDAEIARAAARKVVQQAEISRTAAQRDLERYQRAFEGGAGPQNELATAQDQLKKAEIELASARKDFALQGEGAGL